MKRYFTALALLLFWCTSRALRAQFVERDQGSCLYPRSPSLLPDRDHWSSSVPRGAGVLIMACDDIVVEGNIISGNDFPGMAFTDFSLASNTANDPDSAPSPNRPAILNSVMCNNGNSPAPRVRAILAAMLESRVPDIVDPGGIAEYAANPVKKRPDYPQMPLQAHLDRETLLAAAKHMLKVER